MNIDALRAFLHVAQFGSFTRAAAHLGVMQSTVSARIQTLESEIGCPLFIRSRSGTLPTRAGQELRVHAESIVRAWDQARQQVALPEGITATFRFGGPVALQDGLTVAWVMWMRENAGHAALQIESGSSEALTGALAAGMMDAAIMYLPQQRSGLVFEELLTEDLVLVRHPALSRRWQDSFITIDWGFAFRSEFAQAFPDVPATSLSVGAAALGLRHLRALNGAAYLPRSLVEPLLAAGDLVAVPDVPVFQRPVFLVYPTQPRDATLLELALGGLRAVTAAHKN
ncbi:MAG: LysR family transcriptional regulator [Mesorhizobium amorphae]|nr:MAG: LysR family transcriptional regulator [Mesorhizobium amorphae]